MKLTIPRIRSRTISCSFLGVVIELVKILFKFDITHGAFDYAPHPSFPSSTVISTNPLDHYLQCLQHHPLQPLTALTSRLKTLFPFPPWMTSLDTHCPRLVPMTIAMISSTRLPEYAEPVTLVMYLFKTGFCKFYSILVLQSRYSSILDIWSIDPSLAFAQTTCHV